MRLEGEDIEVSARRRFKQKGEEIRAQEEPGFRHHLDPILYKYRGA